MKKYWMLLLIGIIPFGLNSCGDDDDEGGASGTEADAGAITADDGIKYYITGVDWMRFDYDSDWLLTGWGDDDYYYWDVSYDPLYMEGHCLEYEDSEETTIFSNFSINSSGYVTQFTIPYSYSDDEYSESGTTTCNLTYNSSGQLTKIVSSGSYKATEDGYTYTESGSSTYTLTWSGNVITSWTESDSGSGSYGYEWSYSASGTFDYGDYEYANSLKQYTMSTAEWFWGDYSALAFLGYFGVGPSYLPVKMSCEEEETETYDDETDTYDYSDTESYSYGFNDNGTINWENWGGYMVYYTYSDGSSTSSSAKARQVESASTTRSSANGRHNLFSRKSGLRDRARMASGM